MKKYLIAVSLPDDAIEPVNLSIAVMCEDGYYHDLEDEVDGSWRLIDRAQTVTADAMYYEGK